MRRKFNTIYWFGVAIFLGLLVFTGCGVDEVSSEKACSEYENHTFNTIPARCLTYFNESTVTETP